MRAALILAAFVLAAFAQDRGPKIADIRAPSGAVAVTRGDQRLEVRPVARRVVNGDVYDSDRIETAEAASCDVIFADDSRVSIDAGTQIVVEQRALRQPTDAGKTIGRRIQVIAGHITSDIIPSPDVQTDFVTPAGTAAVRGTLVDITVDGGTVQIVFDAGDGVFFLPNGQGQFPVPDGSGLGLVIDDAAGTLAIENIGPEAIVGRMGDMPMQLPPGSQLHMMPGPDGFVVQSADGVLILDADTGLFVPCEDGTLLPPPDRPMLPPGETLVPMEEGGMLAPPPPPPDSTFQDPMMPPPQMLIEDIANSLATAPRPSRVIDNFERPASLSLGTTVLNGRAWIETPEPAWEIIANSVRGTLPNGSTRFITVDIGHLNAFDIEAMFRFNKPTVHPFLHVNSLGDNLTGLAVEFRPDVGVLFVSTPGTSAQANVPFPVPVDVFFRLEATFDGSTLCGHLHHAGQHFQVCVGGPNEPGGHIVLGATNVDGVVGPETVIIDNIVDHPPPQ